ncbi:hypothetical protein [Specibacter cremeus]|uniref:hypothetical protein n=1 Tax=Specibacter cremeus TaxID=1629051 RepID=UPI000F7AFAB3|nr:hypothetical protein [Specibacter cremeus]
MPAPQDGDVPQRATDKDGLKSRKHLVFGAGGFGVGLLAGLLLGQIGGGGASEAAEAATSSTAPVSHPIVAAVTACDLDTAAGVTVMDGGKSLEVHTSGKKKSGADASALACVLRELGTPQGVIARMDSTRALDGTQTGTWSGLSASWTYHPDNGFNVVIETAAG